MPRFNSDIVYSLGYVIQKEFHYKKFKKVLESREFVIRSLAYKCEIVGYNNGSFYVDEEKLAILIFNYWDDFEDINIKELNSKIITIEQSCSCYDFYDGSINDIYRFFNITPLHI